MFSVVITRPPNQLIQQFFFGTLPEARQYFDQVIREKPFGQGYVRLIEKRDYCHSFLLDTCFMGNLLGKKPGRRAGS
jgi:hypothetical protein